MEFNKMVSLYDIASIITVILAIIGGVFAYLQWRKSNSHKRAEYISELIEKIRIDESIRSTVYMLDYSDIWYNEKFHGSGDMEKKVDVTLAYFSYICYLEKQNLITRREFKFFLYEITRILQNEQFQDYIYNLYHFSNKFKTPISFYYLLEYGKKNKMFDNDFYDNKAYKTNYKYTRNLNF